MCLIEKAMSMVITEITANNCIVFFCSKKRYRSMIKIVTVNKTPDKVKLNFGYV